MSGLEGDMLTLENMVQRMATRVEGVQVGQSLSGWRKSSLSTIARATK